MPKTAMPPRVRAIATVPIREGEEAGSAYRKSYRAEENVLKEFVPLVLTLVRIDYRADKRIVDCIPYLNHDEKQCIPEVELHELCPEDRHCALERKAHVAAEIARSIRYTVAHAEFAMSGCI